MDTAEKMIARAEHISTLASIGPWAHRHHNGTHRNSVHSISRIIVPDSIAHDDAVFIAESRALLPALAADAKQAGRYERNLCSIAKILTDAGVPLTVETAEGPTIDRIHERVAHLVEDAKRAREEVGEVLRARSKDMLRMADSFEQERRRGFSHVADIRAALTSHPVDDNHSTIELAGLRMTQISVLTQERDRAIERAEKAERERDEARAVADARLSGLDLSLLRQYQAACARWTESKDPRDEAEVARLRGQLAIVALPKGGE